MRFAFKRNVHWMLAFVLKITGYLVALNLMVLLILWLLETLYLVTTILIYEALFLSTIGIFQILGSRIHREDSIQYRYGTRLGWWDYRKFSKLKPEERNRCHKEGKILLVFGIILGLTTASVQALLLFIY